MSEAKATHKKVRVRATAPGFDLGRRRKGDEFDALVKLDKDGKPVMASWFELVPEAEVKPLPKPDKKSTLSAGANDLV